MFGRDQAAVTNHADQAARRVSSAAKTDNIDFVTLFVFFGEKLIALHDVEFEPGADGAADKTIVPLVPTPSSYHLTCRFPSAACSLTDLKNRHTLVST
jgi:hypothetical protein